MMGRRGMLLAALSFAACSSEPPRLVLQVRSAADPTLLDGVDTFVFSVEDRDGRPLLLRRAPPAGQIQLDDIPHGPQLTFRLEGLFRESPIVRGRTCPVDILEGRPLPDVSMFVSRAGSFSRVSDPRGETRSHPLVFARSDGVVIAAAGRGPMDQALASATAFDPRTGSWSDERALAGARRGGAVALLDEGQSALLVGGEDQGGQPVDRLELYQRASGFSAVAGAVGFGGVGVAATALSDGRVLVTGGAPAGQPARAEAALFDGDRTTLVPVGPMMIPRRGHTVSVVGVGAFSAAFVIGGDAGDGQPTTAAIETYNPRASSSVPFTLESARLSQARAEHTATTLRTGEILVAGGRGVDRPLASAEIFDPITRSVATVGAMGHARLRHTATLLHDGRVLLAGGVGESGPLRTAELYDPNARSFAAARPLSVERADHAAVELCDGTVLVMGGGAGAEIYNPTR